MATTTIVAIRRRPRGLRPAGCQSARALRPPRGPPVVPPSPSWSRCVRAAAQTEIPVLVGARLATLLHLPAYVCGRWSHVVLTHGRWTMTRAVALVVVRPHSSMAAPEARPPPSSPAAQTTPCHHHQLDDRALMIRRACGGGQRQGAGAPRVARGGRPLLVWAARACDMGVDMVEWTTSGWTWRTKLST